MNKKNLNFSNRFFNIRVLIPFILQSIAWPVTRLIFVAFTKLEINGIENLKNVKNVGVIFAANHSSEWDPLLVSAALPWMSRLGPLFYVSLLKENYLNSSFRSFFYGGIFFRLMGAYPATRGLKDYEKSLEYHINILNSQKNLCVFPEGRKGNGNRLGEGKGGVAFLSHYTNSPVVPVSIKGIANLSWKELFSQKRRVSITFGQPLFIEDIFEKKNGDIELSDYKKGAGVVMKSIERLL